MVELDDMQDGLFPRVCGHIAEEAYRLPVPIPKADEMIHASEGKSVLFIWRDRWFDQEKNEAQLDQRHVCLARMDLSGPGNTARILVISTYAIAHPTWVTSIVRSMGFDYEIARFGSMRPEQVPVDLWQTLREAVLNRAKNLPLPAPPETVSEYVERVKN